MRQVSAFLRRHLPRMLWALIPLAVVVVVWIFSTPIAQWVRSAQSFDAVAFLREHLRGVGLLSGCIVLLVLLVWLPKRQASGVQDVKDRLTIENAARQTLAQVVRGAVLIAGLFFTWANLKTTQETATKNQEIAREGQITDRFTKAIAQLGEQGPEKLALRLGGIYALERIARDSEKDFWPIMEALTAYVRENAPWRPNPPKDTSPPQDNPSPRRRTTPQNQPATDIQAVLTVLGRRTPTYAPLDLRGTDLHGADLKGALLADANLRDAPLEGAELLSTYLEKAQLWRAHLQKANLRGAHLEGARNLTVEQLSTVRTLYEAHLDPPLLEQLQQQYLNRLAKPQN
jgi:Pentapeptide repeats (8 copies)